MEVEKVSLLINIVWRKRVEIKDAIENCML